MNAKAIVSPSSAQRLAAARELLSRFPRAAPAAIVGASRGAADELAREIAAARGAAFGLARFSFTELAARLAARALAADGFSPISVLGHEAVAARAVFEATQNGEARYFAPVARLPGFPRALARTLLELRLAEITTDLLTSAPRVGRDLAALLARFEAWLAEARASDRARLFETATAVLRNTHRDWVATPVVFLDVPFESPAEEAFLGAVLDAAPEALVTVPAGDEPTLAALDRLGVPVETLDEPGDTDLMRLRRYLFAPVAPPARTASGECRLFSAPGEGRECVEIARRLLAEARAGVRFDEMAVLVRSPQSYLGLLEHAFDRAGIPAYFDRGTRRPDPSGRAFLALVSCAVERFSARRFAEYLSLGEVPRLSPDERAAAAAPVLSDDEALAGVGVRAAAAADQKTEPASDTTGSRGEAGEEHADAAVVAGTLRAPWKWETLIVEASVIGGPDRWARRLDGLAEAYRLKVGELEAEDPDSPRLGGLRRDLANLEHLRAFAVPIIDEMSRWPETAPWGTWLAHLEALAPRVLRRPSRVLAVLADLRPMSAVGPATLAEVRDVLADRLRTLEVEPPPRREGQVFVGSPHQARGRTFRVVFVPGLAEGGFPQKLREDPVLLDEAREAVSDRLVTQDGRAQYERLLLRLVAGAATDRLYLSYPRFDPIRARARVPSFYVLEVVRAVTGRVPDPERLDAEAARAGGATLAWPAPDDPADAIDDLEHDLAVLRRLLRSPEPVTGRAHYLLRLNECLRRSVIARWARARPPWSPHDGLVRVTDATTPMLASQRLTTRPYSVSALQRYAACPYQFLLYAVYGLSPFEPPEPLERLDPLTKGSLFHRVQAEFFRALEREKLLPIRRDALPIMLDRLDETLDRVAAEYHDELAPAVERVWQDEMAAVRTDLRIWVQRLAQDAEWEPWRFEFAFGLPESPGRDPASVKDPVRLDGRFLLRGSVDLVERRRGTDVLRVTDHKTGKYRLKSGTVIDGGRLLQPVLYSLAVEAATGSRVEDARFFYCTNEGGFAEHPVPITDETRRLGIEVLEIIDRAVEIGFLAAAPNEGACALCDYLPVCGSPQESRVARKSQHPLADLLDLRNRA